MWIQGPPSQELAHPWAWVLEKAVVWVQKPFPAETGSWPWGGTGGDQKLDYGVGAPDFLCCPRVS